MSRSGDTTATLEYCQQCISVDRELTTFQREDNGEQTVDVLLNPQDGRGSESCPSCRDLSLMQDAYGVRDCFIYAMSCGYIRGRARSEADRDDRCHASDGDELSRTRLMGTPRLLMVYLKHENRSAIGIYPFPPNDSFAMHDLVSVKACLRECDESHDVCNKHRVNHDDAPMYLVDVLSESTALKTRKDTRYVASSYVWGN
ncbi:hypothetical protein NX059_007666 [Plenodomus lindquistii]|nr:hypothetical protein NX059_007666 [Plenodomus lindquistii]